MTHEPRRPRETAPIRRPPDYRSRSVQYRLLPIVFSLMVVLVLMGEARKAKNWQWLWRGQAKTPSQLGNADSARLPADAAVDVDTRLPDPNSNQLERSPDSFRSEVEPPPALDPESLVGGLLTDEDVQALKVVRDDTVLRGAEFDVWYRLLSRLQNTSALEVKQRHPTTVAFTQLFRQSGTWRGRLVRVAGTVHRAHYVTARENDYGITGYWQCWLFQEGGTNNPIVVYSLEMPPGFPKGMSLRETVTFDGIYYKRWAYQAKMGLLSAPLVLAKLGDWQPAPKKSPVVLPPVDRVAAIVVATALAAILLTWWAYRRSTVPLVDLRSVAVPKHLPAEAEQQLASMKTQSVGERIAKAVQGEDVP